MAIVYDIKNIQVAAQQAWQEGRQYKVWAFDAAMGAGKTTFIHALCEILKVTGTPSSPTFAIINEYESPIAGTIYHMDWYRLKDEDEAIQAGVEDCLYSGSLCLVEWPGKAPSLLPTGTLFVTIEVVDENTRRILISH
jgi:tRNA threonylcarbamoyladenosine biosynthesis protein TsaE